MRLGKLVFFSVLLCALFSASATFAAQDRYVRLRSVEGEVTVYPSDSDRPNDATINTPLLDGDEIQTGNGRAELSFRNGIIVRIGDFSALRIESTYSPMRINLTQGTVFLDSHLIDRFRDELELRAGDAQVYLIDEGDIRVDFGTEGSVRVTTIEGQAEVRAGGRRVLLNSGERTYVDPGNGPERPEAFNGQSDELDDWNYSRMDNYAQGNYGGGDDQYLNEDMYYDGNDLSSYGDWRYEGTYGNVWVPHVDYGWRPYYDGRWIFCNGGWFWVSYEPWGWAPYHYGRWGWGADLGWYWIPGNTFAPAWVSWYSYGDYIGWCPLNYYNNPIYYGDHQYADNNYPSIVKQKTLNMENSWNFVKKNDLGARNVKQALLDSSHVKNIHIDKNQLSIAPKKDLVSYVIPKTQISPGWVNDKRVLKQPQDIKNPLGVKNKEEQFERNPILRNPKENQNSNSTKETHGHNTFTLPKSNSKAELPKSNSKADRNDPVDRNDNHNRNNDSDKPSHKSFTTPKSNSEKSNYDRSNSNSDRDSQFKRNESRSQHYSPFLNPYYKGRPNNRDDSDSQNPNFDSRSRNYDSFKHDDPRDLENDSRDRDFDPRTYNPYDRYQDVNPKYRDEAKKYFERFDHKNRSDVDTPDSSPRNYDRPDSSPRNNDRPDSSPRSYEPPKRDYHTPEAHRPESHSPSNNNNSSHSRPSNNSHNDKPGKPHK